MKRILKYLGFGVLGLVLILGTVAFVFYRNVESKRKLTIEVSVKDISVPSDEAARIEGQRLVKVKGCADCHGEDLAGKSFIDDPAIGVLTGTNLTRGKGSAVLNYQDVDWVRSMRFGISPTGRPLVFMPAGDFHGISLEDLGKMIAYLKTVPPVDRDAKPHKLGPLFYVLYNLGQMPLAFPFEEVDLKADAVESVPVGATVEYGKYLAQACIGCHGSEFQGGHVPGTPPAWPDAKNLTPGGRMATWSLAEFKKTVQEGITPDGHQINPQFMPWTGMQAMTATEIEALYVFLRQIPSKENVAAK